MKLSKARLAEIIKEEISMLQAAVSEADEVDPDADAAPAPQTGDAEKIAVKAEKLLGPLFERINSIKEFDEVMRVFLNMASQKIKPNQVKKVLVNLSKEATQ